MTHAVKEITLQNMLDQGKSSELLREEEALRFMEQGELVDTFMLIYLIFSFLNGYQVIFFENKCIEN